MSQWSKVPQQFGKLACSSNCGIMANTMQKSGAGLGTLANMGKPSWEPIGRDRWSSTKDKEYSYSKAMSTAAYARKLAGEEELRQQTRPVSVSIGTKVPKRIPSRVIYNDL